MKEHSPRTPYIPTMMCGFIHIMVAFSLLMQFLTPSRADIDGNGVINVSDVTALVTLLLGVG